MAASKRLTPEQIVARLRDAEKMQGQERRSRRCVQEARGIRADVHRWRSKYGALKEGQAIRLNAGRENARLKRIVAEQALDISVGRCRAGKLSEPSAGCGGDADA